MINYVFKIWSQISDSEGADQLTADKEPLTLVFGSQTGTAESYVEVLCNDADTFGIPHEKIDPVQYEPNLLLMRSTIIFIVSTYGEGQPTDNFFELFERVRILKEKESNSRLRHLSYAIYGIGDSNYRHYNRTAKNLESYLESLGAKAILPLRLGDTQNSLEDDFEGWKFRLWEVLCNVYCVVPPKNFEEVKLPSFSVELQYEAAVAVRPFPAIPRSLAATRTQPCYASVRTIRRLIATPRRNTRHIELHVQDSNLLYQAGDHIGILPRNSSGIVEAYAERLNLTSRDLGAPILLRPLGRKCVPSFPSQVSLRDILTWHIDLCGVPRKSTLRNFAQYCTNEKEKEYFISLLGPKKDSREKYCKLQSKIKTTFGFLRKFTSCSVPLNVFLEFMPRLQPRYFSLASDPLSHEKIVHILVREVSNGLCSSWLQTLSVGDSIPLYLRESSFHHSNRYHTRPIIMIAAGTGIAPFIGFMHRRLAWASSGKELGDAYLFYGCRCQEELLYCDFLSEMLERPKVLTSLCVAYSREGPKKYVQDEVRAARRLVWNVVTSPGHIYICGDAKGMARDVDECLLQCVFMEAGGLTRLGAEELMEKMERTSRLLRDVWTSTPEGTTT